MTQKLPGHLHAAYEWTEAAGELDGLKDLTGAALLAYCRDSAENWQQNPSGDEVSAGDLLALHEWLAEAR